MMAHGSPPKNTSKKVKITAAGEQRQQQQQQAEDPAAATLMGGRGEFPVPSGSLPLPLREARSHHRQKAASSAAAEYPARDSSLAIPDAVSASLTEEDGWGDVPQVTTTQTSPSPPKSMSGKKSRALRVEVGGIDHTLETSGSSNENRFSASAKLDSNWGQGFPEPPVMDSSYVDTKQFDVEDVLPGAGISHSDSQSDRLESRFHPSPRGGRPSTGQDG